MKKPVDDFIKTTREDIGTAKTNGIILMGTAIGMLFVGLMIYIESKSDDKMVIYLPNNDSKGEM